MLSDKIKELSETKAKLAALEQAVAAEISSELAALPAHYGFASAEAFIAAVRAAGGAHRRRSSTAPARPAPTSTGRKRRKRATITDAIRAAVKKLVAAGKTSPEIAKAVGISEQSVFNVKKSLGLTRKRK